MANDYMYAPTQPSEERGTMKRSTLVWMGLFAVVTLYLVSASRIVHGQDEAGKGDVSKLTHLNGTSRQIVQLSTLCLQNDNFPKSFLYDRQVPAPFTVPMGSSFVITDINIVPFCQVLPNPNDRFLVVVTIGGARTFTAGFIGAVTQHYSLTGGLVIPEGASLDARNTTFSSTETDVELLGYFVRGAGLNVGEPFQFRGD
jgi:hypothetical protein